MLSPFKLLWGAHLVVIAITEGLKAVKIKDRWISTEWVAFHLNAFGNPEARPKLGWLTHPSVSIEATWAMWIFIQCSVVFEALSDWVQKGPK